MLSLSFPHTQIKSSSLLLPKLINECHFVLVKCPEYNGSVNYDNLFRSFFDCKRYVELNDLIAIRSTSYPQIFNEFNMQSTVKQAFIFFKCTNLDRLDWGIIDRSETRIYLTGSKNSHIPRELFHSTFDSFADFVKHHASSCMLNSYFDRLKRIVQPYVRIRSLVQFVLLTGAAGSGKAYLLDRLACCLRMHLVELDADDFVSDSLMINESKVKANFQLITIYAPCIVVLKNVDILIKSLEGNELRFIELISAHLDAEKSVNSDFPTLLIATSSTLNCDQINESSEFGRLFAQQLHIDDLRYEERLEVLTAIAAKVFDQQSLNRQQLQPIDLELLAKETNGLNFSNLINLFKKALQRALQSSGDQRLTSEHLLAVLDLYRANLKTKNDLPDIPNVNWSDVGGLMGAKKEIFFTIQLTLKYGKFLSSKLKRSGLLFYGPPGTGKTLLAKAIATEFKLNFLSVKGPEMMNMYIGQSEENIRNIFAKAKSVAPSIIFFDELDSIARKRGKNNSSSGVMDRLVSTLLTELDTINEGEEEPVFVIGATNRPDLLDPALLRHGRFDKLVFIGLDNGKEQRLSILRAITRKFDFDEACTLEAIESNCPANLTGADFYGLCSSAYLNALKRKIDRLELGDGVETDGVAVCMEDFQEAIKCLRVSIKEDELAKYQELSRQFSSK